jgi:hypothetical protein
MEEAKWAELYNFGGKQLGPGKSKVPVFLHPGKITISIYYTYFFEEVLKMSKKITVFFIMAVVFGLAANSMAVTDDADILYVGPAEIYTLDGTHSYNQYVDIQGTLYVTGYNGSGTTGTLELIAPQITVSGQINGDGRGFRGEANYQEGPGCGGYPSGGGGHGGVGGVAGGGGGAGGIIYGTANGQTIEKGSGGGDTGGALYGGGNGGAAVTLKASTLNISGTVTAKGTAGLDTTWGAGGASGGGILIVSADVTVSGTLSVNGGRGGNGTWGGGGGGGGRTKIFYALSLNTGGSTIAYSGGAGGTGTWPGGAGGTGTYYTEQIIIDNADYLIIPIGKIYNLDGSHSYNKKVQIDGALEVNAYNGSGTTGTVELQAPQITVSGIINANGKGFRSNEGPGTGTPFGSGAGAGYGGIGGNSGHGGTGGSAYGTATGTDIDKGSGGSEGWNSGNPGYSGGAGGGLVILNGSIVTLGGTVNANGLQGGDCVWGAGGGSGGGILIKGSDIKVTGGTLSAFGGRGGNSGGNWGGGGGGGGRIKIFSCCSIDTTGASIVYSGGAGGSGNWPGAAGQTGSYYTYSDNPAPWRGTEATYQRWEFMTPDPIPPADQLVNPYGVPQLNVLGHEWAPVWGGREGIWALSGTIKIRIPDRSNSGPESLKIIWLQLIWTAENPSDPAGIPLVTETSGPVAKPSAKYPDCTLEYYGGGNWMLSTYTIILRPNPEYEEITITGNVLVDKVVVETICIPGLRTADLNGDGKVDFADLAIFANNWLKGT